MRADAHGEAADACRSEHGVHRPCITEFAHSDGNSDEIGNIFNGVRDKRYRSGKPPRFHLFEAADAPGYKRTRGALHQRNDQPRQRKGNHDVEHRRNECEPVFCEQIIQLFDKK